MLGGKVHGKPKKSRKIARFLYKLQVGSQKINLVAYPKP